ncbi:GHKL domain-containing protein [Ilyomonas limi]|uniref:histidine kinase n=1 Tax=Ilyomonas limi TaxID=2575867 RepID=A0A4U3L4C9_9BACT|nr:ATP-binding protein [Ilyomonas limi]TKK69830.1 GHKL domain-containing protein [Ilyomonas limi]
MNSLKKHRLVRITIVYWFLLVYIVVALIFWYMELNQQNRQMYEYQLAQLHKDSPDYRSAVAEIEAAKNTKTSQYIGEGSVFLLLILVGAVFVYRATRRQFILSRQQQNFMMAITHELKTPIAVVRLNVETLQKRRLEEAQQQKLIANTLQEVNRLNTLTNNILVASQLETGAYRLNKQQINISRIATEAVRDLQNRFPQRSMDATIQPEVYMQGEDTLMQLLLNNLLDNAVKYSSRESPVKLLLKKENSHVIIQVTDEGIGIAAEEKKKVFEKFYRVGSEETRTAKGTGLGLFLSKKIVQDFKGTITITDNVPKGSIFTVRF